jgi:antitoxin HicB
MVTVPALAGCITQGDTIEEALAMGKEAIELYIEELQCRVIVNNTNRC